MRTSSWFVALSGFAVIFGLSVVPAKADTVEMQLFGPVGPTSNIGLSTFNATTGFLDSATLYIALHGIVAEGASGEIQADINGFEVTSSVTNCQTSGGCILMDWGSEVITDPSTLLGFESPFIQTFAIESGDVSGASVSGVLTYHDPPAAVPEPAAWGLLLSAMGICVMMRKRVPVSVSANRRDS
jgi:hypothetical protein